MALSRLQVLGGPLREEHSGGTGFARALGQDPAGGVGVGLRGPERQRVLPLAGVQLLEAHEWRLSSI